MKQHVYFKYLTTIIVMMVVSLLFIQAYAFDSSVNLAVGKPAVARDSREFDGSGTNPAFVTDNSMVSHWSAQWDGAGAGSWIYVDLQNYYMVNKVIIEWRSNRWPNGAWKLQVATNEPDGSGNSNWVDVYTGSAGTSVVAGTGTYEFTATAGRFVRMLGIAQSTGYGYNIFEIRAFANDIATAQGTASSIAISPSSKTLMVNQQYQFQSSLIAANGIPMNASYTPTWSIQESTGATINETTGLFRATQTGTFTINCNTTYESSPFNASATVTIIPFDASQNLALNKTATTSGATASNGNDGSLSTRWRSSNANQKEWLQIDLGADYVVNNVNIKMNGDAGARGATYNILVSLTGLSDSWQTVVSTAQIPAGSGTEFNSHTIASVPARYIKYDGITRGGWDHNFAEFEVRGTGFYHAVAAAEFTSILFNNTNVIENEEVALTIAALDAENSPYLNATITGLEVTEGNTSGVTFEKRSNVWYARGVSEGTYTLTATGVDDENGSIVKTGTATLTVTEARRVTVINMSTPFAITKYAANRSIGLTLGCTDQYGAAINPTIIWDIQGAAGGSVTNNRYTPANKGTAVVRATSVTTAGTIQSSSITFDVITDAANVALNKSVTSISGATGGTSVVDGDEGSQWIVPHPGGRIYDAWLIIDLQAKYYIELVEVIWEGAYSKTFSVDYSNNGVDFTTKYNGTNTDPIVNKVNKFYTSPSSARYVRIRSTEAGTDYGTKILDVYIHGKSTTITTNSNSNLSTSDYTTDQLANSDLIISSNEIIVDQNTTINSIIVNPGAKLTLNSGQTLTAGTLRLESSSSGTGTFVDKNLSESTQAINATVQQYLPSGRNWYVSSPVTTNAVPSGSTYFGYQEAGNNSDLSVSGATAYWKPYTAGAFLTAGKGYIAQPLGETTLQFSGILNSGNTTVQLSRTALAAKAGFNLVGNPYPSYLDWSMVATANPNVLPTAWFRTKKTTENGGGYTFATVNVAVPSSPVVVANSANTTITKYIPPMQAYWVRLIENPSTTDYTVTNVMRDHFDNAGNKFKAPKQNSLQLVRLLVSNGNNSDETVLYFNEEASDGFDRFDSPKMFNNSSSIPEIYTLAGKEQVVINGRNGVVPNEELPLGFITGQSNTFTIKATEISNFDADTKIMLRDNLLNKEQEISDGIGYSFTSNIASTENRFSIIFKSPSTITGIVGNSDSSNDFVIYRNANNQITVNCNSQIIGETYVEVHNSLGQKIFFEKMSGNYSIINKSLNSGVYMVTVKNDGKTSTQKVILN